jgi:cytochrome c553
MNVRRFSLAGVLALLVLGSAPVWAEGDAAAGKLKTAMCQGCHGIEGFRVAYPTVYSVPMLGGQSAPYIAAALKAYRSGDRNNATMHAIAADLTDQDIDDLAAYYSSNTKK